MHTWNIFHINPVGVDLMWYRSDICKRSVVAVMKLNPTQVYAL